MSIFKQIEKHQKKRNGFYKGDEFSFYLENRNLLTKMPKFSYLINMKQASEFDIMRANIILRSYLNKTLIEEETSSLQNYMLKETKKSNYDNLVIAMKEKIVNEPYYKDKKVKLYIPFFSKAINLIYLNDPIKLTRYPYASLKDDFNDAMIDPFDTYGYELYNSYFTKLIMVCEQDKTAAFFHYDTNTIYIINEQGRLDCKIVLFDKYIRKPNYNHMLERINVVSTCSIIWKSGNSISITGISFDKEKFLDEMKTQGFMSPHMYHLIKLTDWRKKKQ